MSELADRGREWLQLDRFCSAPGSDQPILPIGDQGWSCFPHLHQCAVLLDALLERNILGLFLMKGICEVHQGEFEK